MHVFEKAGLGKAPFRCVGLTEKVYQSCQGAPVQPGGSCDYCGTGIRWCFDIRSADGKRFVVGSSCVERTAPELVPEIKAARRTYKAEKREAERAEARKQRELELVETCRVFIEDHPGLEKALELDHPITRDIHTRFLRTGKLSPAQIDLVMKIHAEETKPLDCDHCHGDHDLKQCPNRGEVVAGRDTVRGRVLGGKWRETQYGTTLKLLILTESGATLWGSSPKAFSDAYHASGAELGDLLGWLRGQSVEFTATVSPSNDDPHFGFYNRPSKAKLG